MKTVGDCYEDLAANWLQARGLQLVRRNYRCKLGEIDLIAIDDRHLVFVEVRARRNPRFASAAASVDWRKQRRLVRTAQYFLQRHPRWTQLPCRFDVIAIEPRQSPSDATVQWIRAAFSEAITN